jgi:hypothetical protein
MGTGTGTLTAGSFTGSTNYQSTTGDVDNDGDDDIVVAYAPTTVTSTELRVWKSNGNGTFAAPTATPIGTTWGDMQVALGDIDADGDLDAAVAGGSAGSTIPVLKNDGTGAFGSRVDYSMNSSYFVFLVDYDGDGDRDLVSTNGAIYFRPNLGGGSFGALSSVTPGSGAVGSSHFASNGDFDADGKRDLFVRSGGAPTRACSSAQRQGSRRRGQFPQTRPATPAPWRPAMSTATATTTSCRCAPTPARS